MSSPGQELRKAREAKHISIEEMAASTKIVGRYLTAVEEDRLDALPQGFFIKGILRTYAKALGLDEDEILRSYREAGILPEVPSPESAPREVRNVPGPNILRRRIMAGAGIIVVVVGLMFVWRACRPKPQAPKQPGVEESVPPVQTYARPPKEKAAPAETLPAGTAAAQEPAKPQPQPESPAPVPAQTDWKGLTLEISFQETTWIRIYCDGALRVDGNYPPGERITARAEREMLLHIGNAGGFTYFLNGRAGRVLGPTGFVIKDLRITPDSIADFLENKEGPGRTG